MSLDIFFPDDIGRLLDGIADSYVSACPEVMGQGDIIKQEGFLSALSAVARACGLDFSSPPQAVILPPQRRDLTTRETLFARSAITVYRERKAEERRQQREWLDSPAHRRQVLKYETNRVPPEWRDF